jgi:iron complex transport system ATP-binding protein
MISVKNLCVEKEGRELLSQLSVKFNKGQFWAILGKNGTGKTTLLHTLAGFNPYSKGSIKINDQELKSLTILSLAQQIALLPQLLEASLNCTVKQSISYGRYPWHKNKGEKNQDQQLIQQAITNMELDGLCDKNIQQISGGELRKVEIATILAQNSETLLLDEPLNHLDVANRLKLMKLLQQLSQNKSIIIVTHDIQYVQEYCSDVILLLDDKTTIIGKTIDVMTANNLEKMLGTSLPNRFMHKTL